MSKRFNTEKGQALILIVFAIVGLIGLTALTVDGGNAYSDHRHAQNAADTAVLAGARALIREEDWKSAALSIASQNDYVDTDDTVHSSSSTANVEVYRCDEPDTVDAVVDCGVYDSDEDYIQVKITSVVDTWFAPIVGIQHITNKVTAIARVVPGDYDEMFDGNAVVGLAPHDCQAVKYQGNADTTVIGGGIHVQSDCENTAFFNNSAAAELTAPSLCAVGGITYEEDALDVPSIKEDCPPKAPIVLPNPTCGTDVATWDEDTGIMTRGSYSGTFPPTGVDTLESGMYCVDGDFRLGAQDVLTGHNVLIVVIDGDVDWNGGAAVHLDAPDSGDFQGLLLYLPPGDPVDYSHTVSINGNSASTLTGTFLAPVADCSVNGTGDIPEINGQLICYTVDLSGTADIIIRYNDLLNWDTVEQPQMQLTQ